MGRVDAEFGGVLLTDELDSKCGLIDEGIKFVMVGCQDDAALSFRQFDGEAVSE